MCVAPWVSAFKTKFVTLPYVNLSALFRRVPHAPSSRLAPAIPCTCSGQRGISVTSCVDHSELFRPTASAPRSVSCLRDPRRASRIIRWSDCGVAVQMRLNCSGAPLALPTRCHASAMPDSILVTPCGAQIRLNRSDASLTLPARRCARGYCLCRCARLCF